MKKRKYKNLLPRFVYLIEHGDQIKHWIESEDDLLAVIEIANAEGLKISYPTKRDSYYWFLVIIKLYDLERSSPWKITLNLSKLLN